MSRRRNLRLTVSLVALAIATGGAAGGVPRGVVLKYHDGEGDRATYEVTAAAHAKIAVNDGVVQKGEFGLRFKTTAEFLGLTPDETIRIQGEVISGTTSGKVAGKTASAALTPSLANYEITPCGETKYRELASGVPPAMPDVFLVLAPDDAFLTGGVGVFPKTPVGVGSAWHGSVTLPPFGGGADDMAEMKYDSKVVGQVPYAGKTCYRIKTDYHLYQQGTLPSACLMKGQNVIKLTTALDKHARLTEFNGVKLAAK
jgi:hypothetical protein